MAESIGYEVIDTVVQHRKSLHHTYCVGPGKLEEIKQLVAENDIEAVVFANTLPSASSTGGAMAVSSGLSTVPVQPGEMPMVSAPAPTVQPARVVLAVALALGLAHIIIGEKLYDADYVAKYTNGFDALKELVRSYDPERVSAQVLMHCSASPKLCETTSPRGRG